MAQLVKNSPAMRETWIQSLCWEDSGIWKRRERLPTPVFWPRDFHGLYRGLRHTLCVPGPRDPTETETELCLSVSCRGTGQHWTAAEVGALDAVDLDMA